MEHGHIWLVWILIGATIGWLAGRAAKDSGLGRSWTVVIALAGALLGGFLTTHFGFGGISGLGLSVSLLIAAFGAVVLTFLSVVVAQATHRPGQ